jgi:hypothetical protein
MSIFVFLRKMTGGIESKIESLNSTETMILGVYNNTE